MITFVYLQCFKSVKTRSEMGKAFLRMILKDGNLAIRDFSIWFLHSRKLRQVATLLLHDYLL